jgi:hypothetical protein
LVFEKGGVNAKYNALKLKIESPFDYVEIDVDYSLSNDCIIISIVNVKKEK